MLISDMNSRQRKTLEAIFSKPTPKSLPWRDVESLFRGLGFMLIQSDGSKLSFERDALSISFHRPHPRKEAKSYQIQAIRAFFDEMGERP